MRNYYYRHVLVPSSTPHACERAFPPGEDEREIGARILAAVGHIPVAVLDRILVAVAVGHHKREVGHVHIPEEAAVDQNQAVVGHIPEHAAAFHIPEHAAAFHSLVVAAFHSLVVAAFHSPEAVVEALHNSVAEVGYT